MLNTKEQLVLNAIKCLEDKDLSIDNIVEYIDYVNKIRYSEKEIIGSILFICKNSQQITL